MVRYTFYFEGYLGDVLQRVAGLNSALRGLAGRQVSVLPPPPPPPQISQTPSKSFHPYAPSLRDGRICLEEGDMNQEAQFEGHATAGDSFIKRRVRHSLRDENRILPVRKQSVSSPYSFSNRVQRRLRVQPRFTPLRIDMGMCSGTRS